MSEGRTIVFAGIDAITFLLSVSFITYVFLIVVPFFRHKAGPRGDGSAFGWHFLVPCLNEELVIEGTVRCLIERFPSAHVWCVDDGSDDRTPHVLASLDRQLERLHVVSRRLPDARRGKGEALNAGWAALMSWLPPDTDATRVIVGVADADGELDPNCPDVIAGTDYFGDPRVDAVQVQVRIFTDWDVRGSLVDRARALLVRVQDMEFATLIAAMQLLRRHTGSVGMGGNGQFTRLSALNRIADQHGSPWHGALLEDFELGVHLLLTGGRNEFCNDTWVIQQGLPTLRALVRQRSRWAQGQMQCLRYLKPVLATPSISLTAALEITYFLFLPWVQLFGSALYFLAAVALVWVLVTGAGVGAYWSSGAWGLIPLFILFGLGPLMVWGPAYRAAVDRGITRRQALILGLAHWPYTYIHHMAVWWGFVRIARSQHGWKKTGRVARAPQPALALLGMSLAPAHALGRFVTPSPRPLGTRWEVPGRLSVRLSPAAPISGRIQ